MNETDWQNLYLIALSHGKQLETQRLSRYWFRKFVESIGFELRMSPHTGVTPLFCDLIWRRRAYFTNEIAVHDELPQQNASTQLVSPRNGLSRRVPFISVNERSSVSSLSGVSPRCNGDRASRVTSASSVDTATHSMGTKAMEQEDDQVSTMVVNEEEVEGGHCTLAQFQFMMQHISVRCYQSFRCAEMLHRFGEKTSIVSTSMDRISTSEAVQYAARKYFAKTFDHAFVARDAVITMDPSRSTLSPLSRLVIEHLVASTMDSLILPLFRRFAPSGLMTMDPFFEFVRFAFQQMPEPYAPYVRAIFCQVNSVDTASMVIQSEDRSPELELDEFLDGLLLLGVLMFADEAAFPTVRTTEAKVWAFFTRLAHLHGSPMCVSPESDEELQCLTPRVSLVYPSVIPIYSFSSFIVGGVQLMLTPNPYVWDGRTPDDSVSQSGFHGLEDSPSATPTTKSLESLARSTMLRSRTKQNAVAQLSAKLLTSNFTLSTAATVAEATATSKILLHGRGGGSSAFRSRRWSNDAGVQEAKVALISRDSSTLGAVNRSETMKPHQPLDGQPLDEVEVVGDEDQEEEEEKKGGTHSTTLQTPLSPAFASDTVVHSPAHTKSRRSSARVSSFGSLTRKASTISRASVSPPERVMETSAVPDDQELLLFHVESHLVTKATQIAPNRIKLCLPQPCLTGGNYTMYCCFRSEVSSGVYQNEESMCVVETVVATIHRERVVQVSATEKKTGKPLNTVPVVLRLKPVETIIRQGLARVLTAHFESFAPAGRMDATQFHDAVFAMKNVPRSGIQDAFHMFASNTNADLSLRMSFHGELFVSWGASGASVLGGAAKLSFLGFLHAVAFLFLDTGHHHTDKLPNLENFFELAFDEALLKQYDTEFAAEAEAKKKLLPSRPPLNEVIPPTTDCDGVQCGQVDVPFHHAIRLRQMQRNENKALEEELHQTFARTYLRAPPAPNFSKENPLDTPLLVAVRNAQQTGSKKYSGLSSDASMSLETRSGSMKQEYFASAMIRTMKR